jgi:hypothetical protein
MKVLMQNDRDFIKVIHLHISLSELPEQFVGRNRSVGLVTCYGLEGPGIESRWGRDFLHTSRPTLGPTQPTVQWVPGYSRRGGGGKAAGAWR